MKSLRQDLFSPLDQVERAYIRKPATFLIGVFFLTPLLIIFFFLERKTSWAIYKRFWKECWTGQKKY
jgi:hypothetical protein